MFSSTFYDPIGMLAVFNYSTHLNRKIVKLGEKRVLSMPEGHFSLRLMMVDAHIV